ncbi:hypothetical protein [Bythopirellula polymerisocia]|uniref:Carboxypeptidase regulatory-like domain-containing protein n=1 Tax=Bythopirellula polymerisocia TaxID=2528003 RepID=A0A5C6D3J0_9BACT|nr:hypothetical protein [Bythopirellula polymerisocia]TWU29429.1 hypothetical protein Pla144_02070 [Bythopirellula polymerisocia]
MIPDSRFIISAFATLAQPTRSAVALILFAELFCWGCSGGGPQRFALSGQVTYDAQHVTDGTIGFAPSDTTTRKGIAADIVDGHYDIPASQGPVAGTYTVWIEARKPSGKKIPSEDGSPPTDFLIQYIPAAYNTESTLEVEITDDRDELDFNLEKVAPTPRRRR